MLQISLGIEEVEALCLERSWSLPRKVVYIINHDLKEFAGVKLPISFAGPLSEVLEGQEEHAEFYDVNITGMAKPVHIKVFYLPAAIRSRRLSGELKQRFVARMLRPRSGSGARGIGNPIFTPNPEEFWEFLMRDYAD